MFFSIIISTYSRTRSILHALSSVLIQTHPTWEMIIVDQEKTNNEMSIRPLLANDRRIRYLQRPYQHTNEARALGISAARGDIITFLDPDDYFAPTHLEVHHDFFTTHPRVDMIAGKPMVMGSPYIENTEVSTQYLHVNSAPTYGTFFIKEHVFDTIKKLPELDPHHGTALYETIKNNGFVTHHISMPTYVYDRTNSE